MNWIERDTNPFQLKSPPAWWLLQLSFFDPELVIFPSAKTAMYRLARRVHNAPNLQRVAAVHKHPDTTFMAAHNLVPITSFLPTIEWTNEIFVYLKCCDTWEVGGAEKADALLTARDDAAQTQIQKEFETTVDARSGSAYRAAKHRLGQTVFVHNIAPSRAAASPSPENGVS